MKLSHLSLENGLYWAFLSLINQLIFTYQGGTCGGKNSFCPPPPQIFFGGGGGRLPPLPPPPPRFRRLCERASIYPTSWALSKPASPGHRRIRDERCVHMSQSFAPPLFEDPGSAPGPNCSLAQYILNRFKACILICLNFLHTKLCHSDIMSYMYFEV